MMLQWLFAFPRRSCVYCDADEGRFTLRRQNSNETEDFTSMIDAVRQARVLKSSDEATLTVFNASGSVLIDANL